MKLLAAACLALLASPVLAESPLAKAVAVAAAGKALAAGAATPGELGLLDCAPNTVQHTILRCKLKAAELPFAACLGRALDGATFNVHFQGEIVNMSVEFASGASPADVLSQLRGLLGAPKREYWADDAHLFASYIWVDGEAEVELTETVKGDAGDGKARLYVSSLTGGRPLSPQDR